MILLQPEHWAPFHGQMMGRVVDAIVAKIAKNEPGNQRWSEPAENCDENQIDDERDGNTDHGRHDQAPGVVGIIVMNAVHHEVELFSPLGPGLIMKCEPVHDVFEQSPTEYAGCK